MFVNDAGGGELGLEFGLVDFFEQIRRWYGHNPDLEANQTSRDINFGEVVELGPRPASFYDLGQSHPTRQVTISSYVRYSNKFGDAFPDEPALVNVAPPDFSSFFNSFGLQNQLTTITGPINPGLSMKRLSCISQNFPCSPAQCSARAAGSACSWKVIGISR